MTCLEQAACQADQKNQVVHETQKDQHKANQATQQRQNTTCPNNRNNNSNNNNNNNNGTFNFRDWLISHET